MSLPFQEPGGTSGGKGFRLVAGLCWIGWHECAHVGIRDTGVAADDWTC